MARRVCPWYYRFFNLSTTSLRCSELIMEKPKTDREAFDLVLKKVGTKIELARRLGVVRQLVGKWHAIPLQYVEEVSELIGLPIGHVAPEVEAKVTAALGRRLSSEALANLIRIFIEPAKAWSSRHTRRRE